MINPATVPVYEYNLTDHLGNVRVLLNEDGNIEQKTDYYPFGLVLFEYSDGERNRYLYNGKELQEKTQWHDYGARMYDGALGRWHVVDPLTDQYSSLSPYNYVANNPIIFVDPDGREIKEGKEVFNKFRQGVKDIINSSKNDAESLKARAAAALEAGNERKAARLTRKANRAQSKADSYNEVLTELNDLDRSDQVYNIYTSSPDVSANGSGNVQYDTETGDVNVNIKDRYNEGALAHELKHAYQFEKGALSFGATGETGGSLYDLR